MIISATYEILTRTKGQSDYEWRDMYVANPTSDRDEVLEQLQYHKVRYPNNEFIIYKKTTEFLKEEEI
jgi:hypothetical protein